MARKRKTLLQRFIKQFDLRCGARTKGTGEPCRCRPFSLYSGNGRCKWHGGMSTGAKTPEGMAKSLSKLKQNQRKNQPDSDD